MLVLVVAKEHVTVLVIMVVTGIIITNLNNINMAIGNEEIDFVLKTKENLQKNTGLREKGDSFHSITNLLNSCLGLIVYPHARLHSTEKAPTTEVEIDYGEMYGKIQTCRKGEIWNDLSLETIREHMCNALTNGNIIENCKGNNVQSLRFYSYDGDTLVFDAVMTPSQLKQLALDIANRYMNENR